MSNRPPKYFEELLVAFGELRADVKHVMKTGDEANKKIDDLSERVGKIEPAAETVREMKPVLERFKKYEQGGIAVFAILTLCGSVFGGVILRKLGWEVG